MKRLCNVAVVVAVGGAAVRLLLLLLAAVVVPRSVRTPLHELNVKEKYD